METEVIKEILDLTGKNPYIRRRQLKTKRETDLMEKFDNFMSDFIKVHTKLSKHPHTKKAIPVLLKEMFPSLAPSDIEKLAVFIRKQNYADRTNKKFNVIKEELDKINKERIDTLMDSSTRKELYITLFSPEKIMFLLLEKEIKYERNLLVECILTRAENTIGLNKTFSLLLLYYKTLYEQIKKHDPFTKFNIKPSEYLSPEDFMKSFSEKFETLVKVEPIAGVDNDKLEINAYKLTRIISKYVQEEMSLIVEIAKIMILNQEGI